MWAWSFLPAWTITLLNEQACRLLKQLLLIFSVIFVTYLADGISSLPVSVCLSVCLSVYVCVCLPVCLTWKLFARNVVVDLQYNNHICIQYVSRPLFGWYLTHCGLVTPCRDSDHRVNISSGNGLYLMAPSYYLNQCWHITWAQFQYLSSITNMGVEIAYLKGK